MNNFVSPRKFEIERQLFRGGPGDIPIVHTMYNAYAEWNEIMTKFPKRQRYTLGETCSRYLLLILEFLLIAASTASESEKLNQQKEASAKLDVAKTLIRLAKDCKCISSVEYQKVESLLIDVGKMLGGWIKTTG